MLTHVHEGISSNNESGVNFQVGHLESLYKELLEKDNISYSPNVARFCESPIEALPHDVEKRKTGNKLTLFAKKDIDAYLLNDLINPNSFIDARIVSFFGSPDPKLGETVLSRNGLLEHVKRSAYQAGWLWRECLLIITLSIPALWGLETEF